LVCDRSLIATCTPMPPALPTIGVHLELIHVRFDNKDVQKLRCGYDWSFDSCSHCCRPWAGSRVMARVNQCGSSGPQKAPFPTVALVKRAGEVRYETYRRFVGVGLQAEASLPHDPPRADSFRLGHSKTGSPAAKVLRHRSDARSHRRAIALSSTSQTNRYNRAGIIVL
jgi:hypothetical protein